jgi:3-dehydroquinate dehydratase
MTNQEKLDLALSKIKAVKGNTLGKRDRIKYYSESLDSGRWDYIDIECVERFDFEKEVIKRQNILLSLRKPKREVKPYNLEEFRKDMGL